MGVDMAHEIFVLAAHGARAGWAHGRLSGAGNDNSRDYRPGCVDGVKACLAQGRAGFT
jgi:hypothetical protein